MVHDKWGPEMVHEMMHEMVHNPIHEGENQLDGPKVQHERGS